MSLKSILLLLALFPCDLLAQKEYNIWCFGNHAGIDFNGVTPRPFRSEINSLEGSASIADRATGELLFYSDGETVYNRDGEIMPNGSGLKGNSNSTQPALIVPVPGSSHRYYLFVSDAGEYDRPPNEGISYSIVDMSLDGGDGDVTIQNVSLLRPAAEKLTAVRGADGCSFWVLAHGWNDSSFHAFLVSDSGVSAASVISNVGLPHRDIPRTAAGSSTIGEMKVSPDGRRLAIVIMAPGTVQLFDFNNSSGIVSNPVTLPARGEEYGVSFSPDNSKLYVALTSLKLYQYNLAGDDSASIASSEFLVHSGYDSTYAPYGGLQIAPDGRIYLARIRDRWLGLIAYPNASGSACGYQHHGVDIGSAGGSSSYGLPNMIDGFFLTRSFACGPPVAEFALSDTTICVGDCIDLRDRSANAPASWIWSAPGASVEEASGQRPASICYSAPGIYRVTLVVENANGADTAVQRVTVSPRGVTHARIGRDYHLTPGDPLLMPVVIDVGSAVLPIDTLLLSLRYRRSVMKLHEIVLAGSALDGWRVEAVGDRGGDGSDSAYLIPPVGAVPTAASQLCALRFTTYLDSLDTSTVDLSLTPLNGCGDIICKPGFLRFDLCGISHRYIESTGFSYALDRSDPNPFNPSTTIRFSLGLDGYTMLVIYNAGGEEMARLINGLMPAGEHQVIWDASGFPSGRYYCRITSGDWSDVEGLVLTK